ncbi:MAG: tetratricopeptide repeat protein [Persicimonas sp.]
MKTSVPTRFLTVVLTCALTLPPSLAFAGPEEANEYYEESARAYEEGEFDRAAELLERAYEEDQDLIYQYNRILALQADGEHEEALEVLDEYEEPLREDGRFDDIGEIGDELEQAQARIEAGESEEDQQVDQPREISDEQEGAGTSPSTGQIAGWSLTGAGGVFLGMGALFGSTLLIPKVADRQACMADQGNTYKSVCYENSGLETEDERQQQFRDDRTTWQTHQTMTWISLGIGTAAALGGGALLLFNSSNGGDADQASLAPELQIAPYATADGAGGQLRISF